MFLPNSHACANRLSTAKRAEFGRARALTLLTISFYAREKIALLASESARAQFLRELIAGFSIIYRDARYFVKNDTLLILLRGGFEES